MARTPLRQVDVARSMASREQWDDPGARHEARLAQAARWADPEYRSRQQAAISAGRKRAFLVRQELKELI